MDDAEQPDSRPTGAYTGTMLLDVRLLRLFDALYATRSVTRAAHQLGQAQPTVSIWLGRLRQELADPLFVRTASGLEHTPRADELIATARAAIEILQRLTSRPKPYDPVVDERCFNICMTDASHVTLLPKLLSHMRSAAPNARIEALQIDTQTAARLQSGEADLALGLIPALEAGFYQQSLYGQDWICLANAGHPRLRRRLTRTLYEAEAHLGIVSGTGQQVLEAALAKAGVQRRVVLRLPGFLGLGAILSGTDLIATLPRHTGETLAKANGLTVHACPIAIPSFTVKQHWHGRYHHDPANRWLRETCANLFQASTTRGRQIPTGELT
ncbi:MAG: LysR family transcriptional regulator [Alphaproteobacteria bacterium]|nr:MAG: LysR family transcriptional regulator [Alphaproteobacteria bacterium]